MAAGQLCQVMFSGDRRSPTPRLTLATSTRVIGGAGAAATTVGGGPFGRANMPCTKSASPTDATRATTMITIRAGVMIAARLRGDGWVL